MLLLFINPLITKTAFPVLLAVMAFVLGVLLIRNLRKQVGPTATAEPMRIPAENTPGATLAAYEGVILDLSP